MWSGPGGVWYQDIHWHAACGRFKDRSQQASVMSMLSPLGWTQNQHKKIHKRSFLCRHSKEAIMRAYWIKNAQGTLRHIIDRGLVRCTFYLSTDTAMVEFQGFFCTWKRTLEKTWLNQTNSIFSCLKCDRHGHTNYVNPGSSSNKMFTPTQDYFMPVKHSFRIHLVCAACFSITR